MRELLYKSAKPLLILLFLFCSLKIVNAQPLTWEKLYSRDVAFGISRISDTTFYLCGNRNNRSIVMKINQYGDTLWKKEFSDSIINFATAIVTTEDNGCVISGYYNGAFTAKYDVTGNLLWRKTYNSGVQIKKLIRSGNAYYGCGSISNMGYIIKVDINGNFVWEKFFNSYPSLTIRNLCFDSTTNSIISAGVMINFPVSYGYINKIDTSGNILFEKLYKILRRETDFTQIAKLNNDFIIAGRTFDSNAVYSQAFIVRINSSGDTIYKKIYPSASSEIIGSLFVRNNNRLIINSRSDASFDTLNMNFYNADTLGNILQSKTIKKVYDSQVNGAIPLSPEYNVFVGYVDSLSNYIWVIKTDSLFNINTVGIANNNSIVNNFSLSQNYPNPFNPSTKISYSLNKSSNIELKLFDINGRMIKIIESGFKTAGSYEINFNSEGLSSGVYFYTLSADGIVVDTKKAVVLK